MECLHYFQARCRQKFLRLQGSRECFCHSKPPWISEQQHALKRELWKVMGPCSAALRSYRKRAQRSQLITGTLVARVTGEDPEVSWMWKYVGKTLFSEVLFCKTFSELQLWLVFFLSFLKAANQLIKIDNCQLRQGRRSWSWTANKEDDSMQPLQRMTRDPLPHFLCRCSTWGHLRNMQGYSNTHTTGTPYAIEHQDAFPCWRCSFTSKMLTHRTQNVGQFTDKVKDGVDCRSDLGVVLANRSLWSEGVMAFIWGLIFFLLENRTKQWRDFLFFVFLSFKPWTRNEWQVLRALWDGVVSWATQTAGGQPVPGEWSWPSSGTDSFLVTQKNRWNVRCLWAMGAVMNPEGPHPPTHHPRRNLCPH